jgi:hypothetical protein
VHTSRLKRLVVDLPNDAGARFQGMRMQDAHEFLALLLNALHEELNEAVTPPLPTPAAAPNPAAKADSAASRAPLPPPPFDPVRLARDHWESFCSANTDVLSALFYAQSAQYVICARCQHASCSHSVLGQLTLDIPHKTPVPGAAGGGGNGGRSSAPATRFSLRGPSRRSGGGAGGGNVESEPVTLDECLRTILASDRLEDYACARCKSKGAAFTSAYLTSLPEILLVQLKRFVNNGDAGGAHHSNLFSSSSFFGGGPPQVKDETACSYPEEVDLAPLLQPDDSIVAALLADNGNAKPYKLLDDDDDDLVGSGGISTRYKLVGVVRHHDEHYTAFTQVRPPPPPPSSFSSRFDPPPPPPPPVASSASAAAWCFFNDSKTYIEPLADVLAHEQHVYLLLYQRV